MSFPFSTDTVQLVPATAAPILNARSFGAYGNGVIDDTAAIRRALSACATAGGGTVFIPNGTYIMTVPDGSEFSCLTLPTNVSLIGESKLGTILKLKAGTQGSVRIIYVSSSDSLVESMTLDGNKTNNSVDEHRAGVFVESGAQRVTIRNVRSQNHTGDGITFHGGSDFLVDGCHVLSNDRDGIALTGGGNTNRATIRGCQCVGNASQQIDSEPPDGILQNILITGNYLSGGGVSTDYALTIAGHDQTVQSVGYTVTDNWIDGTVWAAWANDVLFANNHVVASGVDGALMIYRECVDWTVIGNRFELAAGSTAAYVIGVLGTNGTPNDAPTNITIADNLIITNVAADGILAQAVKQCRIMGNDILGCVASAGSGHYGVDIRALSTTSIVEYIAIRDNHIRSFFYGVVVSGNGAGSNITDMDISHNQIEGVSGFPMATGISWDFDGAHSVQQATCIGNSFIAYVSAPVMYTYPATPMLIGGTRGAGGIYSGVGAPTFSEATGAQYMRRDGGSSATLYVNTSGGGVGTTWTAK